VNTVAIIPARGGSKGVPGKNVRLLGGRPLIAHTIEHARQAALVDRVVVSTDDDAIAAAARVAGAEVVPRPAELAGDRTPSEAALVHAVGVLRDEGWTPEQIVFLQCTAPLRRPGEIDAALRYFRAHAFDSLFTAVRMHPFRWRRAADGLMERLNVPVDQRPMRQDREPEFIETGSFYILRRALLDATGIRLGGRIGCWEMPPLYSFDIDTADDFAVVEALLAHASARRDQVS
jgi:N-acylneuraminate cytidylyltransferase